MNRRLKENVNPERPKRKWSKARAMAIVGIVLAHAAFFLSGSRHIGTSWTEVSQTRLNPQGGIHTDQHTMARAGGRLVVGNDGGLWSTANGGATWSDHNAGLAITQFYDGSVHPGEGDLILGDVQGDGTSKWTGGSAWQWIWGGDGADNAISASHPHPDTDWLVSLQYLVIRRTADAGVTWRHMGPESGMPNVAVYDLQACPGRLVAFTNGGGAFQLVREHGQPPRQLDPQTGGDAGLPADRLR